MHAMGRGWVLVPLLWAAGCRASAFACSNADDCSDGGRTGTCQADGWCSFPDDECPSGERYGDLAGGGLAGTCVDPGGSTGTSNAEGSNSISVSSLESTLESSITLESSVTLESSASASGDTTGKETEESGGSTATTHPTTGTSGTCGDGNIDAGEECDAGDLNGQGDACRDDCVITTCGDDYVGGLEQCEPAMKENCSAMCTLATCGNGELDEGEACDGMLFSMMDDCTQHGFVSGSLSCSACVVSTSGCEGCGLSCDFGECDNGCDENEHCTNYGMDASVCTAPCNDVGDCPGPYVQVQCIDGECALPCMNDDDCPSASLHCFMNICAHFDD